MAYQVPPSKRSLKQNQFEIVGSDGKSYVLPSLKYLDPKTILAVEEATEIAGFKILLDRYAPGFFESIEDAEQIEGIMEAWKEFSGIDPGES